MTSSGVVSELEEVWLKLPDRELADPPVVTTKLTKQHVERLLAGRTPAIHVKERFSRDVAEAVRRFTLEHTAQLTTWSVGAKEYTDAELLGTSFDDAVSGGAKDAKSYFVEDGAILEALERSLSPATAPPYELFDQLSSEMGFPVVRQNLEVWKTTRAHLLLFNRQSLKHLGPYIGKPMKQFVVRVTRGRSRHRGYTPIHADFDPTGRGMLTQYVRDALISSNFYCATPPGGELVIWRNLRGQHLGALHRPVHASGPGGVTSMYDFGAVLSEFAERNCQNAVLSPEPGDLIMLNTNFCHEVRPIEADAIRVTMQLFLGYDRGVIKNFV